MGKIPDRWLQYGFVGKSLRSAKILSFKTPLTNAQGLPKNECFPPATLLKLLRKQNVELGLVIDLTNTTRYYSSQDFTNHGVQYQKMFTPGQIVPPSDIVKKFIDKVKSYFHEKSNEGKHIGVHCTHGINRTGYFVCKYLIDVLGLSPNDAAKEFNAARGHPMERKNFLEALGVTDTDILAQAEKAELKRTNYRDSNKMSNNTDRRSQYRHKPYESDGQSPSKNGHHQSSGYQHGQTRSYSQYRDQAWHQQYPSQAAHYRSRKNSSIDKGHAGSYEDSHETSYKAWQHGSSYGNQRNGSSYDSWRPGMPYGDYQGGPYDNQRYRTPYEDRSHATQSQYSARQHDNPGLSDRAGSNMYHGDYQTSLRDYQTSQSNQHYNDDEYRQGWESHANGLSRSCTTPETTSFRPPKFKHNQ